MPISDDVIMFYGAKPEIFEKAATLRNNMTEAEKILWEKLKDRKLFLSKFRRQHPIDIFIVDFYCHNAKLVVELDGEYHLNKDQIEYDSARSAEIENWGLKIIRFTNKDVFDKIENVVLRIQQVIAEREAELNKA